MNKELIIELISMKIKLIRTEKGYTQDKMAEVLGISKKTLVQI
ncbi:helix-turn-helix domain-containing protein, partial [Bacillus cereus]